MLLSKYTNNLKLNNKKTNSLILKMAKDLKRNLTTEDKQMVNKHMKSCSTSYVIREMRTKTMMTYYCTTIGMVEICYTDNTNY